VDYAHTPDSLEQLYKAFPHERKICVLGNCGGGRDTWKRPAMAKIAEQYCDEIVLTNEDPYDEDPDAIVRAMADAIETKQPTIIMDRRLAIRHALTRAQRHDVVLVSGKGTDPYIMGPKGTKTPWSDERVVREELRTLLHKTEDGDTSGDRHVE
jgi:UDP-N-acetylmuramoyl-L-alanyl-D-glutamate--2,6-diaminopimelate ligase